MIWGIFNLELKNNTIIKNKEKTKIPIIIGDENNNLNNTCIFSNIVN